MGLGVFPSLLGSTYRWDLQSGMFMLRRSGPLTCDYQHLEEAEAVSSCVWISLMMGVYTYYKTGLFSFVFSFTYVVSKYRSPQLLRILTLRKILNLLSSRLMQHSVHHSTDVGVVIPDLNARQWTRTSDQAKNRCGQRRGSDRSSGCLGVGSG